MTKSGKNGVLELEILPTGPGFRRVRAPLSLGRILHSDPSFPTAHVIYVRATGGGLAQGDHIYQHFHVRDGAHAIITSQSATRVHSMTTGYAEQFTVLAAEPNTVLEYLPDPVIPSRDCHFHQHTKVLLAPGATAIVGDSFTAGRVAHGEFHDAAEIDLRAELRLVDNCSANTQSIAASNTNWGLRVESGFPSFIERAHYVGKQDLSSPITHGDYRAWASLWVVCPKSLVGEVLTSWQEYPQTGNAPLIGASSMPDGLGIWARFMGNSIEHVAEAQHEYWDRARRVVLGAPAFSLRKM